mmetsp:Transcript_39106/g.72594  ORF Transcript_39106/g.72594 Transcript_39106/m.72594 type:complete len:332 (-) Transcript_39106:59-1054(-)
MLRPDLGQAAPRLLPGVAPQASLAGELGVVAMSAMVIGSVPALPIVLAWLFWRAWRAEEKDRHRAWTIFAGACSVFLYLVLVPTIRRPKLMQTTPWRWWLEYMRVRVAYRTGEPPPLGQYLYLLLPHGLYPFSGACACLSRMVDVFPNTRMAVAPVGLKVPLIRNLMAWIGSVGADKPSMSQAFKRGDSVCLFPGGIGEMMRTDSKVERLLLRERKGFVRVALEHGISIVPIFVFGQSETFLHTRLPSFVERLSRRLGVSIIFPYGRWGLLVPRKVPLLYAVGAPIAATSAGLTEEARVDDIHGKVVQAVHELYNFYKGTYGWSERTLSIE